MPKANKRDPLNLDDVNIIPMDTSGATTASSTELLAAAAQLSTHGSFTMVSIFRSFLIDSYKNKKSNKKFRTVPTPSMIPGMPSKRPKSKTEKRPRPTHTTQLANSTKSR